MTDYDSLKTRAEQVRDEQTIGGNTALRVGQLLCDMVDNMEDTDSKTVFYLDSMGEELDGASIYIGPGMVFYDPDAGTIKKCISPGTYENIGCLDTVVYCNKVTNILYRWSNSSHDMIQIAGSSDDLVIGNVLNGQGDVLGMSGAMQIKANVDILAANLDRLYTKLDNLAFWSAQDKTDAAPTALDWGAPKHTVTLSLTLTHAVVKYNGVVKNNGDAIPNVEEGSTIQLTVEAESGYELDSISSQAGTVNGSTVSLVMGTSNATLDITASASAAYTISYDLSNCAAPTGVTNPTTIKSGETKTIYLEAGNNFTMPASLPVGAVTGATASYTRDALDDTKATLVLSNATGNVTVDIDGVEVAPELHLVLQALIDASNGRYFIQGGSYNSNAKKRAMVVVKRAETSRPCTWGSTDGVSEDAALEAEYSAIPIPIGATQITMKCNSTYYYTIGLLNSSGVEQNADSAWTVGSTQKSWLLADYPNATHIKLNFKIGSGGTTNFANETWETIGIDFNIE